MRKKVKDYKIVKGYETYEESFGREINELIKKGYKPLGTTKVRTKKEKDGVRTIVFFQVMILCEEK